MEFCSVCGTRMQPKKVNSGSQTTILMYCSRCANKKYEPVECDARVNAKFIEHNPKQLVAVIGKKEQELHTLPTIRIECPRCGNSIANVWQVQTRGSDESSTQFLRCINCNYTIREYT